MCNLFQHFYEAIDFTRCYFAGEKELKSNSFSSKANLQVNKFINCNLNFSPLQVVFTTDGHFTRIQVTFLFLSPSASVHFYSLSLFDKVEEEKEEKPFHHRSFRLNKEAIHTLSLSLPFSLCKFKFKKYSDHER